MTQRWDDTQSDEIVPDSYDLRGDDELTKSG